MHAPSLRQPPAQVQPAQAPQTASSSPDEQAARIVAFIREQILGPLLDQTQSGAFGAARALASKDPDATAPQPQGLSVDDITQKVLAFLGLASPDRLTLSPGAPARKPPKPPRERRKDSIGLVRRP